MTEDEARDQILNAARNAADWWIDNVPTDTTIEKRVTGAIFTFLAELDGTGALPPVDLVVTSTDENDMPLPPIIVSTMLHEHFHNGWRDA